MKKTYLIGWSSVDITPDKPILNWGQRNARISESVLDTVTATVKVLKGFKKVNIIPGETITVDFLFPCRELGLWNKNMK